MPNQTLDNILFFSNGYGQICAQDSNHQIIIRGDRNGTAMDSNNHYQFSGNLSTNNGHAFWGGGTISNQTLKFQISNDGNYMACPLLIGTKDIATHHPGYMSHAVDIVGSRPGISLENTSGTLNTIRLKGTNARGEMHINFNGSTCTDGGLYFYTYGCTNRSTLTLGLNGNVGIGVDAPFSPHNGNGLIVRGNGSDTRGIIELWDSGGGKSVLQQIGGNTYLGQLDKSTGSGDIFMLTGGSGTSATISMTIKCAGNVGLGTTTPCTKLSVKCSTGSIKIDLLSLTTTDGAGSQPTMRFDTIEANCNVLGRISVCDIAPYAGTMIFETSGCKGIGSTTTTELMRLVGTTGNVGINTTSPSYRLHVNGTFYAAGSSQDYKQGICNYNTDSCLFMCLKPKTYQYKDEWKHLGKDLKSETQIGLIAEEVAESHPELAILVNEEDNKVVRNVDYEKLSIILLSEVQKLRQEVDQLKNK
jgi:hypothetical protein